jgi:hypothetical protein
MQQNCFNILDPGHPPEADFRPRLSLNQGYFANISSVEKPRTFPLVKQVEGIVILICH